VFVGVPRLFTRPLRLNAVEAWELLAAGRAAMELPGAEPDGPLARGLAKLAEALGDDDTAGVRVDLDRPDSATALAAAAEQGERVRISYWSPARDEVVERTILPRQVFTDRGEWYVTADDDRSGEIRIFRIDRIEELTLTGDHPEPLPGELPVAGEWFNDDSYPQVTLRLRPGARWAIERYPFVEIGEPDEDGSVTATMAVASEPWFVRMLVRLGPDADVVSPMEWRERADAAAAAVLARYERT